MKKISNTILLALLISAPLIGQYEIETIFIDGKKYPSPSLTNIVYWLNQTSSDWESDIKKYSFPERTFNNGCVSYGTGTLISDVGIYAIDRCPGNVVSLSWTDMTNKGKTIMDELVIKLEPHFLGNENEGNSYGFNYRGYFYRFIVNRSTNYSYTSEFVIVKRVLIPKDDQN